MLRRIILALFFLGGTFMIFLTMLDREILPFLMGMVYAVLWLGIWQTFTRQGGK
jgi:hypothetical protein